MRKLLCFFIILISLGFSVNSKKSGIEIYLLKKYRNTEPKCLSCFDEKNLVFSDEPILEENDIAYFDWKEQKIILSETGKIKISKLRIELSGIPVIYGFE
ncbi:hypothetical protein AR687_05670 [Flavobacteriaceae bacterium CRH]|nr:hypothetical protein AR687_05670 [Flavobacteriaceae bacterium CRH]